MAGPYHPWPVDSTCPTIGSLLRSWPVWAVDEEQDLLLTERELQVFGDALYGDDQRWFGPQHTLPTLLHSYGAWFVACPCGCRGTAMSETALQDRGVRGFCVTSSLSGQPRLLHPAEAALFVGLPGSMRFMHGPRDSLPLLGNVASPLQALWVYSQLLASVHKFLPDFFALSPKIVLEQFKLELLRQFHQCHDIQVPLASITLAAEDGTQVSLLAPGNILVADLIKAERLQLHPDMDCIITDGRRTLSRIERLIPLPPGRSYHVKTDGPYAKVHPAEVLVLALHDDHAHCIEFLHAGQFLFEALDRTCFEGALLCVDSVGRLFPRDARIWQSLRLKILSQDTFPTLRTTSTLPASFSRQERPPSAGSAMGPGLSSTAPGLGASAIDHGMASLLSGLPKLEQKPIWLIPVAVATRLAAGELAELSGLLSIFRRSTIQECFGIFAAHGHWALIWGRRAGSGLHWTYFDPLSDGLRSVALDLAATLSAYLGGILGSFEHCTLYHQADDFSCGTLALLHMASALGLPGLLDGLHIQELHFWLLMHSSSNDLVARGPQDTTTSKALADLLVGHGVFPHEGLERARVVIAKLGTPAVQAALSSKNPWATLKEKASQPGSQIRLVTREELEAQITARAKSKHGAHIPNYKNKKAKASAPRLTVDSIDIHLLALDADHFHDADGEPISHIPFKDVQVNSRGIALCSPQEARPFVDMVNSMSTDALGLLVVPPLPSTACCAARILSMRFPAVYGPSLEPMLVQGTLISLGDVDIHRHHGKPSTRLEVVQTSVFKVVVYKDELVHNWTDLVNQPIRCIVQMLPILQLCKGSGCGPDCIRFHSPVEEELDSVIQEVWARKFLSITGKVVDPELSDIFQFYLRVARSASSQVLQINVDGIYMEPRKPDLTGTDPAYSVVWLPKADKPTAIRALKSFEGALALIRVKDRYGVRVAAKDAAAGYKALRPDMPFVDVTVTKVFRLHPVPHGVQRHVLLKLFKEWNWAAKPMQPVRGSAAGAAWEVGASSSPPKPIMPGFGTDILISEVRDRSTTTTDMPSVISSCDPRKLSTIKAVKTDRSFSEDPWTKQGSDPWAKWAAPTASAVAQGATSKKQIQELESRLQATVQDAVRTQLEDHASDAAMSSDIDLHAYQQTADQRFRVLEAGLGELKAQGDQFRSWFNEVHTGMDQMGKQVATLQSSTDKLSATIDHSITSAFDSRFSQLEAMLSKRSRTE